MPKKNQLDWDEVKPETPLNFGVRSNGEFYEAPTKKDQLIEKLVLERAEENAKRVGLDRRAFLNTAAGMATTLAVVNMVHGCGNGGGGKSSGAGGSAGSSGGGGMAGVEGVQCDLDGARELLSGDELVVDVQSHHIDNSGMWRDPTHGDWRETNKLYYTFFCFAFQGSANEMGECVAATSDQFPSWVDPQVGISALPVPNACAELANHAPCLGLDDYIDLMFRKSETAVAVLSTFPAITCDVAERIGYPIESGLCGDFLPTAAMANTRDVVNEQAGSLRCLSHAAVFPKPPSWLDAAEQQALLDEQLRGMENAVREHEIDAWKCYTPFGPLPIDQIRGKTFDEIATPIVTDQIVGEGWFLDEEPGQAMIEKALDLGVPIINVHKGAPLPTFGSVHTGARDIGVVAKKYPDAVFVVYHSAINHGQMGYLGASIEEGPYEEGMFGPNDDPPGINSLIHSLVLAGIDPSNNTNVYAELGGPGARAISDPIQGTHIFGKFLKYVGEDNIVWGTDAVWGGSPQSLIEGFRAFQMDPAIMDQYDYPELTPAIKAKILGLNAAKLYGFDPQAKRCEIASDTFARMRRDYEYAMIRRPRPIHPLEKHQGPRSRREFFKLWHSKNWFPG